MVASCHIPYDAYLMSRLLLCRGLVAIPNAVIRTKSSMGMTVVSPSCAFEWFGPKFFLLTQHPLLAPTDKPISNENSKY